MDMKNGTIVFLTQTLILTGAAIILLACIYTITILKQLESNRYKRHWQILAGLMSFFFVGYIAEYVITLVGNDPLFLFLAVITFFIGAIFVYIVVRTGYYTIVDLGNNNRHLQASIKNQRGLETQLNAGRDALLRQNDALLYLTKNILGEEDPTSAMHRITEKVAEVLNVDRVSVWLHDEQKSSITCLDLFDRQNRHHSAGQKLYLKDYPVYFRALDDDTIINADDVHADKRTVEFSEGYLKQFGITSMLDATIHLGGELNGVICCEHTGEARKWTIEEISFATALTDIVAVTLETYERKKAETGLEHALALTRATIESTADGLLVVDNEGKITGFNKKFIRMWHIPESIVANKQDEAALSFVLDQLADPDKFIDKVKELYNAPQKESFDILAFKDGRSFERYSKPQVSRDKIIGRVWSFRDITQRRKDEDEIKKLNSDLENRVLQRTLEVVTLNEELQKNVHNLEIGNQELESFSYSVSHDLRAPLRAINGFIGLLEAKHRDSLDEESKKYLETISRNAKKMGMLIDDLLAFSRLGKKEIQRTDIDIKEIVREIVNSMNVQEWNPNTKVVINDLLPVKGDKTMLVQVFFNLIANAIKYSRTKPEPLVTISSHAEGGEHIYCVIDNGVGFSMEYYNKLFKVFQRLHNAEEFEGVGVGLAIVQRIVTRHGGRVWADSEVDKGATFCFSLPNNALEQTEALGEPVI
jgi:signal transduction histidine kinase